MNDLINRQAAIDAIEHRLAEPAYQHEGEDWYTGMNCAESELYDLPPAQPRPKTGHWIYDGDQIICNRCFKAFGFISLKFTSNYCPNCGAKMIEPQESEDTE